MISLFSKGINKIRRRYNHHVWSKKLDSIKFRHACSVSVNRCNLNKENYVSFIYDTTNIGDDIQTIAQMGFIPEGANVKALNRDELGKYRGDKRMCIMNGWFTHRPENWPPSRRIEPIFVSFHISDKNIASKKHLGYYKKHEPIGCRDYSTVELLKNMGVEAYFTGCLTLTLENPFKESERGDYVVVTDSHVDNGKEYPPSAPNIFKKLIPVEVRENAIYIEHEVDDYRRVDYTYKMKYAKRLLSLYAKAKAVVTSRLHCALPCIAMGTPVVFLHRKWENDIRFDGYRDVINGYGPKAEKVEIDWDNPESKNINTLKDKIINYTLESMR